MLFFKTYIDATLADDKLKLLGLEALGARHILMCYIAKSPVVNFLYRTDTDPYTDDEIADLLGINLDSWMDIKTKLLKYGGFIEELNQGLGIPKWAGHQSRYYAQNLDKKREYMREYMEQTRERQEVNKSLTNQSVRALLVSGLPSTVKSLVSINVSNDVKTPEVRSKKLEVRINTKHLLVLFEFLWSKYPNRDGKKMALKHFMKSVIYIFDCFDIINALDNYLKSERVRRGFVKNGDTWFNNWRDWINYTEPINEEKMKAELEKQKDIEQLKKHREIK
jgi:hypothetical protein